MATFKSTPITSDVQNSIDNQTFCKWRSMNIAKKKVGENKSNTLAQQKQRLRMEKVVELSAPFDVAAQIGFPGKNSVEDYVNAFVGANLNDRVVEVNDDLEVTVNYEEIQCAKGRRMLPRSFTVTLDAETKTLTFTHSTEARGKLRDKEDKFYALVVEPDLVDSELYDLDTRTGTEPVTITLPEEWATSALEVYVFALSKDGKKASNSRHLTVS